MKRANDPSASPAHPLLSIEAETYLRGRQPFTASTASTAMNTAIQPVLTGMTNRTGTAILPAVPPPLLPQRGYPIAPQYHPAQLQAGGTPNGVSIPSLTPGVPAFRSEQQALAPPPATQPATASDKPAGDQGDRNIFGNTALAAKVRERVLMNSIKWLSTASSLTGQERQDFLIGSFFQIAIKHGSNGEWNGVLSMIIDEVGMEAMLAQKWPQGRSLMHLLARLKNPEWMSMALAAPGGPQLLRSTELGGMLPLHHAAFEGKKKIVEAILAFDDEAGSLRLKRNKGGVLPLHLACQNGHASIVPLLLSRKSKEQLLSPSVHGNLPIHQALGYGTGIGALPYLLAQCATEQASAPDPTGHTALMLAVRAASPKAVKLLLGIPGARAAQLAARDRAGLDALQHARAKGNAEVIALIEAAMQTVPAASSSTTTSTTNTTITAATAPSVAGQGPAPLTPYPVGEPGIAYGSSDTDDEPDQQ
jgi:hypothetical protein